MILFKRTNAYGDILSSYDLLKLIALITMVIDHLGMYFWPHVEWLRAVGRMAFPLFLFLVGYSGVWKVKLDLLLWTGMIVLCSAFTHYPVFPLNILATIIVTRYIMARYIRRGTSPRELRGFFLVCIVWFPLLYWCSYSTIALLFAMCGYLQRQQPGTPRTLIFLYMTLVLHFLIEYVIFQFHVPGMICMLLVAIITAYLMQHFRLRTYSEVFLPDKIRSVLLWSARNTLPLYALHLMLFMVIARLYHVQQITHFRWW